MENTDVVQTGDGLYGYATSVKQFCPRCKCPSILPVHFYNFPQAAVIARKVVPLKNTVVSVMVASLRKLRPSVPDARVHTADLPNAPECADVPAPRTARHRALSPRCPFSVRFPAALPAVHGAFRSHPDLQGDIPFMKRVLTCILLFCVCLLLLSPVAAHAASGIVLPADPTQAYITLGILLIAALMFFTEIIPLPITALLVPITLSLTGIISAEKAFSYFGDPTVVLFMAMFIVGEGTFITGFADMVGRAAVRISRGNTVLLLVSAMTAVGLLSTVLSNTGTIVVAVPMILGICLSARISPGKILLPVAYAASLGGTVTLVGTPPNGIINSMLAQAGAQTFTFFEFAYIGLPLLFAGLLYYGLVGHRFLPDHPDTDEELYLAEETPRRRKKLPHAMLIFGFVVIMMASEVMPLTTAAMIGACLMVVTRCMTMHEAFHSVDWTTIFLFAGMLSMSAAMTSSGAAAMVAHAVVSHFSNPWLLMVVCCLLTTLLTHFMSNTATAALMAPLALPIANASGISPLPLCMGIAMTASTCFLTPVATPPNTIVLGPGRYSFLDYVKYGWPLQLISVLLCVLLIPLIWPFHP